MQSHIKTLAHIQIASDPYFESILILSFTHKKMFTVLVPAAAPRLSNQTTIFVRAKRRRRLAAAAQAGQGRLRAVMRTRDLTGPGAWRLDLAPALSRGSNIVLAKR